MKHSTGQQQHCQKPLTGIRTSYNNCWQLLKEPVEDLQQQRATGPAIGSKWEGQCRVFGNKAQQQPTAARSTMASLGVVT